MIAVALLLLSGGSTADPQTPPGHPGLAPPFLTVAIVGEGGLSAGVDAYGDIVDLRAGPAGAALIANPLAPQLAGTVPSSTGIVPRVALAGRPPKPLWRADSVRQRYLPGTNVLRTTARFGRLAIAIDCAASDAGLGCVSTAPAGNRGQTRGPAVEFSSAPSGGRRRVHLDDRAARQIVAAAAISARHWIGAARPLDSEAPPWARRMYRRSLLVLRALTDRHSGAVAAGARDGWSYVWPRDAGAVAIALAASGHRSEARRVAAFLDGLDLAAAARFDGDGIAVPGRPAQGDAAGWVAAAKRAAQIRPDPPAANAVIAPASPRTWRGRADYQEKAPGDYLANALASSYGGRGFVTERGLVREAGDPGSGLDSAAAWAVRPFAHPALFPAARRTLSSLAGVGPRRTPATAGGPGDADGSAFGLLPSEGWPDRDPWTAPTAWSAWSLATLARLDRSAQTAARDRAAALRLLAALRRAATPAGLLPERVDADTGVPRSTTPLAWSHAFTALALLELWPS